MSDDLLSLRERARKHGDFYRAAARLMERGKRSKKFPYGAQFACHALERARAPRDHCARMKAVFAPDEPRLCWLSLGGGEGYYPTEQERFDFRILVLCMAGTLADEGEL